ncbi:polymerase [Petrotoga mexicana DSM 14811]|uniref:Polymerase n=1 Tax=Petrotoga mexicana DSM 14811 TaxID=1122954 RepID=A0A2K1PBE3_9BACT|nr:FapA family protein [Petrotoga mexicana]PNS00119.1 polymerase [Petrotoga mexicana DSM 14811]
MAKYDLRISEDGMVASLKLIDDGRPPTIGGIKAFLKEKGVVVGIKSEVIEEIVSEPQFDKEYVIAYGIPPKVGKDAQLIFQKNIEEKLNITENSYVDLKESSQLIIVKRGDILAEIIPPTKGEPGRSVRGEKIEGIQGKELKLNLGNNIVVNNNKIISKIDGKFISKETSNSEISLDVSDEHKIDGNIDYSTGNVRFPGKLIINGDVKSGFHVEATSYLEIKGVVESATVFCEGEAKIFGIKGAGKSSIKVKILRCNYIENANIEAEEDVIVKTAIVNSNIKAGKHVIVEGGTGKISGGYILATNLIEAEILGSEMGVKTICEVGVLPDLNEELNKLEQKITLDMENLRKLNSIIKGIQLLKDKGKINEERLEYYKKCFNTYKMLLSEIKADKEKLETIKYKIQSSKESAFIIAKKMAYPGTEIIIHKKKFMPTKPITKVVFKLEDDEIVPHGYQAETNVSR